MAPALQRRAEVEERLAIERAYEALITGQHEPGAIGYINAAPTVILWAVRDNFVEIAVAQLGKGDVFNLETGIKVAIRRLFEGNYILVPCNHKLPGFDGASVAARLFDTNILNGNAMFDRALLRESQTKFNAEMTRRGAPTVHVQ